jgi:hypothetical protein
MTAQADGRGHLRHVLAADQLGADAGQLALLPLRMKQKQGFGHHQPSTASPRNSRRSLSPVPAASACRLAARRWPARWPLARWPKSDGSARAPAARACKAMPSAASSSARTASTCASIRFLENSILLEGAARKTGCSSGQAMKQRKTGKRHPAVLFKLDSRTRAISPYFRRMGYCGFSSPWFILRSSEAIIGAFPSPLGQEDSGCSG